MTKQKAVFIVSQDQYEYFISDVKKPWEDAGYNTMVINFDEKSFSETGVELQKAQTNKDDPIYIWLHGGITTAGKHVLLRAGKELYNTADFINYLSDIAEGNFNLLSCKAAKAKDSLGAAAVNPIIINGDEKYDSISPMESELLAAIAEFQKKMLDNYGRSPTQYEVFEFSTYISPEKISIVQHINGETESFEGCAPISAEGIKFPERHLTAQSKRLRQFIVEVLKHKEADFISLEDMKKMLPKNYLLRYQQLDMIRNAGKKNEDGAELVKACLDAGVDPKCSLIDDSTALHRASQEGNTKIVELILETKKVDVNTKSDAWCSALYIACQSGHKETAEFLLSCPGIDVNTTHEGVPIFYFLCQEYEKNKELIELLCENGADVNKEAHGVTPLFLTCSKGNKQLADFLLSNGADVNKTCRFTLPDDAAEYNRHTEIAEKIRAKRKEVLLEKYSGKQEVGAGSSRGK